MWLCALVVPHCRLRILIGGEACNRDCSIKIISPYQKLQPHSGYLAGQLWFNSQLWRKTQSQESQLSLALKDDQYAEHSEFEQDLRSLSLDQMIKGNYRAMPSKRR